MKLHELKPAKGSVFRKVRLGRGHGSGKGGTSTRGHKGAKSRSGYSQKLGFEGGQMPLQRRVPKFGFKNPTRVAYKAINLGDIQALVDKTGATAVTLELLRQNGMIAKKDLVKVLSKGTLSSAVEISAHAFSASAIQNIEKVGGKVIKL
ncbi:MAG: 50S ribosomal protein L15 [Cytophagales bacterium]|nr:50S ribosomal protein L15 [Bernardetiaceae bacterium]MDW8204487.1 50S ribosomal protein L15 [Cytophagales bacterium]